MSPDQDAENSEEEKELDAADSKNLTSNLPGRTPARRRTKTGCLTCRKRRIKCGEERPTCKNCIKSKRECAGYVQPLVYKQHIQTNLYASDTSGLGTFSNQRPFPFHSPLASGWQGNYPPAQAGNSQQNVSQFPGYSNGSHASNTNFEMSQNGSFGTISANGPGQSPPFGQSSNFLEQRGFVPYSDGSNPLTSSPVSDPSHAYLSTLRPGHFGVPTSWDPAVDQQYMYPNPYTPHSTLSAQSDTSPHKYNQNDFQSFVSAIQANNSQNIGDPDTRRYSDHGFVQQPTFNTAIPASALSTHPAPLFKMSSTGDEFEESENPQDPFDVEEEDEEDVEMTVEEAETGLRAMLERRHRHLDKEPTNTRIVTSPAQALSSYRPSMISSPLYDERNQWIFHHFIEVTGRWMSIFERRPFGSLTKFPKTLWTFVIPAAALNHTALAHAILALGAVHYAKMQRTSEAPALKHFTYAVRRVGKLLGLPNRRHEIAILAAVLLLGFYEVMAADHSRWNLHLAGATKLVTEHDFAGFARIVYKMRDQARSRVQRHADNRKLHDKDYLRIASIPPSLLNDVEWEVDQDLISRLTGQDIDYRNQFQPTFDSQKPSSDLTEKDVDEYKSKIDLRWWYCKQDVFQSMVSGDPLLLPYNHWKYCPPRAQIGKLEHPHATFDHLLLIMARLADFGGRDRSRKQRAVAAQGGQWRPPPDFFPNTTTGPKTSSPNHTTKNPPNMATKSPTGSLKSKSSSSSQSQKPSPPPSANEGRVRQNKQPHKTLPDTGGPPMFGMIPLPEQTPISQSFQSMSDNIQDSAFGGANLETPSTTSLGLEKETSNALAEHLAIINSFDLFARSLGPNYEPLASEVSPINSTPFGPAIKYISPEIACIMSFYNVGRILIHRLHPHMPPAAMVSAGITAHLTKDYAQTVGRICAGLYSFNNYDHSTSLEPRLAGALLESSFSMFFAAIQYQDPAQRGWTISKLQNIDRMTGWQTSASMAAACESAWEKMGLAGKGPPYVRTLDANNQDSRVNGSARRQAAQQTGDAPKNDIVSEHESQFVSHDRNMIGRHGPTRVHWALGLLSVEEDIQKIDLNRK